MTPENTAHFLRLYDRYLILTHKSPDGDTIGCAAALCLALRKIGKTAHVLSNPDTAKRFLPYLEGLLAPKEFSPDLVVSVDTAALKLFPPAAEEFLARGVDLAIDHHSSFEHFAKHHCVDSSRAACGEVVYEIIQELCEITPEIALPLYLAISTDTGCFVYGNTTPHTHFTAARLMETGIDYQSVNKTQFRTKSLRRIRLESLISERVRLYQNGAVAIVSLTKSDMKELGASDDDTQDIASHIGQIEGVEVSVTLREKEEQVFKISVRSTPYIDASAVCRTFGGGGHAGAAGCELSGDAESVEGRILSAIESILTRGDGAQTPRQSMNSPLPAASGVLLVDKPPDWTSHDVVAKCRSQFGIKRIGHAGTLDPMATGLLPLFLGRATRAMQYVLEHSKTYLAGIRLGLETDTQDIWGEVRKTVPVTATQEDVERALSAFRGEISQVPPMFSALKQNGVRLYKLARQGAEVTRAPRKVQIEELSLLGKEGPDEYLLRIVCSKGTYIRTLCHDIGQFLSCGAVMSSLRRTHTGGFSVEQAQPLERILSLTKEEFLSRLQPVDACFRHYPAVTLDDRAERRCRNGASFPFAGADGIRRAYGKNGEFLMLGVLSNGVMKVLKSFYEVEDL